MKQISKRLSLLSELHLIILALSVQHDFVLS